MSSAVVKRLSSRRKISLSRVERLLFLTNSEISRSSSRISGSVFFSPRVKSVNPHYCEFVSSGHNTPMEQGNGSRGKRARMLLVDDHDDFRVLMHHYLSSEDL